MNATRETTAAHLAQLVGGVVVGDESRVLRRIATLDRADAESLSWVGHEKFLPMLASTAAGAVLIADRFDVGSATTLIRVADPDLALCIALEQLGPAVPTVPPGIDPRAIVSDGAIVAGAAIGPNVFVGTGATVGSGTVLHPGVYIGAAARIGRDCVLWPNVVVRERCTIGDRVIIHPNATIGADGFGYLPRGGKHRKVPQIGIVSIEDDVEIGAGTTIDRAKSGVTRVGRGTKIDNLVQIGHNCEIGEDCMIVAQVGIAGSCKLGNRAVFAGQSGVVDHITVGDDVMVAAQSGVMMNLASGAKYAGTPVTDAVRFARQAAAIKRLPEVLVELRELRKRIGELESSAHHQGNG